MTKNKRHERWAIVSAALLLSAGATGIVAAAGDCPWVVPPSCLLGCIVSCVASIEAAFPHRPLPAATSARAPHPTGQLMRHEADPWDPQTWIHGERPHYYNPSEWEQMRILWQESEEERKRLMMSEAERELIADTGIGLGIALLEDTLALERAWTQLAMVGIEDR